MSGARRCLLRLDHEAPTQALAAAEALALGARPGPAPGLVWSDALPEAGRGAYVLTGGEVVAEGPPGGPLAPRLPEVDHIQVPRGPWKVEASPLDLLAAIGWRARYLPPNHPGPAHALYPTAAGWWLVRTRGSLRWTEPALVRRTSTSLPSRLARAVVNLVARPGERVHDPVCGTGVLLVEAARLGCRVSGGDTSVKAAAWARQNLRALGLEAAVAVRDALAPPGGDAPFDVPVDAPIDAIVGDLPYGLRLAAHDLEPFAAALPRLANRWALVANVDLGSTLTAHGHPPARVLRVPKATFARYVHVGGSGLPGGG